MGISKIGSLFASKIDPLVRQQSSAKRDPTKDGASGTKQSATSTDAVVYSKSISSLVAATAKSSGGGDDARAARLKDLKTQVAGGTYKPESEKVAVAVLKELA